MPFPPRPTSSSIFEAPVRLAWSYALATSSPHYSRALGQILQWFAGDDPPLPPRDPPPDPPPPGPQPPDPDPPPVPAMVLDVIDALAAADGDEFAAGWAIVRAGVVAISPT